MEASPPRRRETFTSLQLQRASDQLQEAIQSARRGRPSRATSLSLLSDLSASGYSSSDHDDDDEVDDQENQPQKANAPTKDHDDGADKSTPEQKLRRFMADSVGSTGRRMGASLSLKDLLASPLRPTRDYDDGVAAQKLQLAGESESGCREGKEPIGNDDVLTKAKKGIDEDRMESQARKAIDVLQRDVEAHARTNRDTQEQLKHFVYRMNDFVGRVVERSLGECTMDQKTPLTPIAVEKICEKWMKALIEWKDEMDDMKRTYEGGIRELEEVVEMRVRDKEQSFQRERDALTAELSRNAIEASDLRDSVEELSRAKTEQKEQQREMLQKCQLDIERLQMQNEDWQMRLRSKASNVPEDSRPSATATETRVLDLLSQLKQYELRELHWQMVCEEQTEAACQAQERLEMLLEDVNRFKSAESATGQNPSNYTSIGGSNCQCTDPRSSLASSTGSSERHRYQQRIEFLEGQLSDLKEQINCDHQQFLYEQEKWDLEKKHLGHDVEEVHGVSVKVLKLLLIREKLLKKQEKKAQKRRDKLNSDEIQLRERQDAIHAYLESALQECGVALLYVRQVAMAATTEISSTTMPVKPIKLVRVIKRLQSLQQDITTSSIPSAPDNSPTTSSSIHMSGATDRGAVPK